MKPIELLFKTGAVTFFRLRKRAPSFKESYIASKISKSWQGEKKCKNANNFKTLKHKRCIFNQIGDVLNS